ncbi:hypothetical protein GDO81_022648 [Engystomops pustulosus]|uniref:Uncharacterized protein n=1 Tax=Engystomops pustulosus TaxID=76066 RepID=A0AAV6ZAI0_ENGPU|nr:hypothetical protein GDO81_022648 [Engystomops pustulosus]KAG8544341.1 hypothetical protein GDO81_022648 [Engystomops pustulosus]
MAIAPTHYIWQRERSAHHSGALRAYTSEEFSVPRGPCATPQDCSLCGKKGQLLGAGLSASSSSSSSDSTLLRTQMELPNTPETPRRNILRHPPNFYHHNQDQQVNGETKRCARFQDKSMAWFSSSQD